LAKLQNTEKTCQFDFKPMYVMIPTKSCDLISLVITWYRDVRVQLSPHSMNACIMATFPCIQCMYNNYNVSS